MIENLAIFFDKSMISMDANSDSGNISNPVPEQAQPSEQRKTMAEWKAKWQASGGPDTTGNPQPLLTEEEAHGAYQRELLAKKFKGFIAWVGKKIATSKQQHDERKKEYLAKKALKQQKSQEAQ